ncbi:MAG TPA: hypothetical protein DCL38_08520 [Lachnospiraceae bacterium]|nr:hypothetical protein [Lachnospiraceae bacterium]
MKRRKVKIILDILRSDPQPFKDLKSHNAFKEIPELPPLILPYMLLKPFLTGRVRQDKDLVIQLSVKLPGFDILPQALHNIWGALLPESPPFGHTTPLIRLNALIGKHIPYRIPVL